MFPAFATFGSTPIEYEGRQQRFRDNGQPIPEYTLSGSREQNELYSEIFDDMPEGVRPSLAHHRIGTSRPRPIDNREGEAGKKWASVNLPVMGRVLNYGYGDERLDSDENLRYFADILAHEHGHAAIDDDLRDAGRRDDLAHEFGAYTIQGLTFDEIQDELRSRRFIE